MESKIRAWLRPQLLDAEEANRTWRLRAIQAEAELRALQVDPSPSKQVNQSLVSDAGDTGGPQESAGSSMQDVSEMNDTDVLILLGQVLGLEKHVSEIDPWKAKVLEDAANVQEEIPSLQAQLDEQKPFVRKASAEATEQSRETKAISQQRAAAKFAHDAKCLELTNQMHAQLVKAGLRPLPAAESLGLKEAKEELSKREDSVGKLEDDVKEAARQREMLRMRREEMRGRRWGCLDTRTQCAREVASAKQALQVRSSQLSRLQGEVSRSRARGDRKRKQLENQLAQCRLELSDAIARADGAGEKFKKLKQQHGRQLRQVRNEASGLQAEVDEHLSMTENADVEIQSLRAQELDLEGSEQRFLAVEAAIAKQTAQQREELTNLEQQAEDYRAEHGAVLEMMRPLEEEHRHAAASAAAAREQAETDSLRATEIRARAQGLELELELERAECAAQAGELKALSLLEQDTKVLSGQRDSLFAERAKLEETSRQQQQALEKQMADFREVQRRAMQLKAMHGGVTKALPTGTLRGNEAIQAPLEQALGRATKKADALQNYLDIASTASGPMKSAVGASALDSSQLSQRSVSSAAGSSVAAVLAAQLEKQLVQAAQRDLNDELSDCKRELARVQQRFVEKSRLRGDQIQGLRQERRELEEELTKSEQDADLAAAMAKRTLQELQDHMQSLDREAANGAEAVSAEFSDLLQKQALEKDALKRQVEMLRKAADEEARKWESLKARFDGPPQALGQQLSQMEAELQTLHAEEEELLQASVRLRACLVAGRRVSPKPGERRTSPPRRAGSATRHVIRASRTISAPGELAEPATAQTAPAAVSLPQQSASSSTGTQGLLVHDGDSPSSPLSKTATTRLGAPQAKAQGKQSPQVPSPTSQSRQLQPGLQQSQNQQAQQLQQQIQRLQQRLTQQHNGQQSSQQGSIVVSSTLRRSGSDTITSNPSHGGSTVTCTLSTSDSTPRQLLRGSLASSLPALAVAGMSVPSAPRPASAQPNRIIATTAAAPPITISARGVCPTNDQTVYTWPSQFMSNTTTQEGLDFRNLVSFG